MSAREVSSSRWGRAGTGRVLETKPGRERAWLNPFSPPYDTSTTLMIAACNLRVGEGDQC